MNKKRALSILMAAAMAAGTLVTSVPVMLMMLKKSHGCSGMTWKLRKILFPKVTKKSLIVSTKSTTANIT